MSIRVLIVDDEQTIRAAVVQYLAQLGYEVDAAAERIGAQALLAQHRYGIVIADLSLSGRGDNEGLDVMRDVAASAPGTPVIVLSAYGSPAARAAARASGATFVDKPLPLVELAALVRGLAAPQADVAAPVPAAARQAGEPTTTDGNEDQ